MTFVGFDLHRRYSTACALDAAGEMTTPTLVATAPVAATTIASPPATQPGSIPEPTAKAA